jgi:phosphoglycerol transferase MdoB-like AlkP superfamily enzyme
MNKYPFLLSRMLVLLFIYTLCRGLFIAFNLEFFDELSFSQLPNIFFGGLRFDITALLYLNVLYLLLVALPLPWRLEEKAISQKALTLLFIIINSAGIIANFTDTVYYQFTLHRTTADVFDIFAHDDNIQTILLSAVLDYWQITLAAILTLAAFIYLTLKIKLTPSKLSAKRHYPVYIILLIPLILLSVIGIRGGIGSHIRPIAMNNAGAYVERSKEMSIVLNTPFTLLRTLGKKSFERRNDFDEQTLNNIFNPIHMPSKAQLPKKPLNTLPPKNIVILIMESFSAEHIGFLNQNMYDGTYKGYTPFLDSLMADSLVFDNAFAHGRKSIDAIPAIISGIPSLKVPYVVSHYGTNEIHGLGSILKDKGYQTSFFHGAPNGSMGFDSLMNLAGFDDYYGLSEFDRNHSKGEDYFDGTWGIWDEEFMQYMVAELTQQSLKKQPFAATFFSLSSHHPFVVPEKYNDKFSGGTEDLHLTMQYADFALEQFFETAKKQPWFNDTLFVLAADHATHIYQQPYKNDLGSYRIPIMFYLPDGSLKEVNSNVAQQADIFPTILELLNIDTPYFSFGSSLLDSNKPKFAINYVNNHFQLVKGDYVLQFDNSEGLNRSDSLFNYVNDPSLNNNLLKSDTISSDIKRALEINENFVKAFLQQYNNRMIDDALTIN